MKNTWRFTGNELNYLREVVDSGFGSSTSGGMNNRFEQAFAQKVGAKYAVTFNSGTSTLHAALHALGCGAGDEVIIPPLTVISNVATVLAENCVPVFADVDPRTFNIDPADVARKITPRTRAIMPVSLYGLSCDLDPLMELAEKHSLGVINDAAEALGATYKGRGIGNIAHVTSYSTENSKHIATGDGGIVVTDDHELGVRMRKFGSLGYAAMNAADGRIRVNKDIFQDPTYKRHDEFGLNYRMPEVAAALGLAQTERMEHFVALREAIGKLYLDAASGCDWLVPQHTPEGWRNTYWTFTCAFERDDLSWQDFRKKYMEFGGDGIYAAWALSYLEPVIASGAFKRRAPAYFDHLDYPEGLCPVAERLQPRLMQFVTNYGSVEEAEPYAEALAKAVRHFA
ncbi:MAG: DegT/DnrJ/EryC1/StrS family aminotransferase [Desulfovibrionaceae bacterium]|jgi:perosamine synthetase|nr:DegT/DnrJ/EryC1/StrS family aminotransferase [Desulfovibrionaceae bacterium]